MTWNLQNSEVHLNGYLSVRSHSPIINPLASHPPPQFIPDIAYWLNASSTYRVVSIQSQASWFVLTGADFLVDAHGAGGINGNGQPWWTFFANRTRADGDGRPIALTLANATRGVVRGFRIEAQPFWCNAVAESREVVYDGMYCNATNTDPAWAGQKWVVCVDVGEVVLMLDG
jgi:galacturan 1,4-alpha-galacturonidase